MNKGDEQLPLGFMLVRVAEAVDREFGAVLAQLALKPRELRLLVLAERSPNLPQRELARQLRMDAGNLIAVLDDLEERGLISRGRNADDRRERLVSLTAQGRRLLARANKATAAVDARIAASLPRAQREQYYDSTLAIYRQL
jgi:DNA-binding MarR family transcriptional regulator